MKKCTECKWFKPHNGSGNDYRYHQCSRKIRKSDNRYEEEENNLRELIGLPPNPGTEIWVSPEITSCFSNREDGWFSSISNKTCGKRARFWEPKEPIDQLKDHVKSKSLIP